MFDTPLNRGLVSLYELLNCRSNNDRKLLQGIAIQDIQPSPRHSGRRIDVEITTHASARGERARDSNIVLV
jgi:hypothetical protein